MTDTRVGAEAVDDGGDLALPAEAAGGARPQLGARLGGEGDVRHGETGPFSRRENGSEPSDQAAIES